MKKLHSITAYALLAPAMTFGLSSAMAQTTPHGTDSAQQQQQRTMTEQAQRDRSMSTADREQQRAERASQSGSGQQTYLSTQPTNAFRSDKVIGNDLMSRSDNESIGSISDLLIDEDGQVVAVIVEVGGFLGMGQKDVAIAWDSVEHSLNEDRDGHDFTVSVTKDALKNAPEYKEDHSRDQRRTQSSATQSGATQSTAATARQRQAGSSQHGAAESGTAASAAQRSDQQRAGARAGQQDEQRLARDRQDKSDGKLSRVPANAFHSDSLRGKDVYSKVGDEKAGTISDFVIDDDGQVLAVIVGMGGMLGIGERNVAISWDSLEHSRDADGDSKFTTSMTRDELRNAPDYDRDAKATTQRTEASRSN